MTSRPPYRDPELSPSERTRDLMQRMSVEEMVGQMIQADGRRDLEPFLQFPRGLCQDLSPNV